MRTVQHNGYLSDILTEEDLTEQKLNQYIEIEGSVRISKLIATIKHIEYAYDGKMTHDVRVLINLLNEALNFQRLCRERILQG